MQFKLYYKIQGIIIENLEKWTEGKNLSFFFLVQLMCANSFQCPRCHLLRYKKLLSTFFSFSPVNFQMSCFTVSPLSPRSSVVMLLLPEGGNALEPVYTEAILSPRLWFPSTLSFKSSCYFVYVFHHVLHHYCMLTPTNSLGGPFCDSLVITINGSLTKHVQENVKNKLIYSVMYI